MLYGIDHEYAIYESRSKNTEATHTIRISWRYGSTPPPILPANTGLDLTASEVTGELRGVWLILDGVRYVPAFRGGENSVVYPVKKIR